MEIARRTLYIFVSPSALDSAAFRCTAAIDHHQYKDDATRLALNVFCDGLGSGESQKEPKDRYTIGQAVFLVVSLFEPLIRQCSSSSVKGVLEP